MGGSLIPFAAKVLLPPEPQFVGGFYENNPPKITVFIDFDILMNQTVVPANASWRIKIDGLERDVVDISWVNATQLQLISDVGAAPAVSVTIELLNADPNLISTLSKQVQPFGEITIFVL